jgi:hypothetical protein
METLIIEQTNFSPRIEMNLNGEIVIHGRSIVEDSMKFYAPIKQWVENCELESVNVDVRLDYINTSSSKQLYILLEKIVTKFPSNNIQINWRYEEGDDETLDLGKDFEFQFKVPFTFVSYAEIVNG